MHIDSKDNYNNFTHVIGEQLQTQLPQQSRIADSSLQQIWQMQDESKGCWEVFTDWIKTIIDRLIAILSCICCKNDQISDDGKYTIAGYDELSKNLNDMHTLKKLINSESFQKIYPIGRSTAIIVPRLDFFQTKTYSEDDLNWIKSVVTCCLGFPRRNRTSDQYSFLQTHIHGYVNLIMGMETGKRDIILHGIIDLMKSKTQLTGNAGDNFGYGVRMMLNDMNARPTFNEFYRFVYPPINDYIVKNVSTI